MKTDGSSCDFAMAQLAVSSVVVSSTMFTAWLIQRDFFNAE